MSYRAQSAQAGSAPACVWWVLSGSARLTFPSGGMASSVSRPIILGELIGLSETVAQIAYGAALKAESECRCLSISRHELMNIILQDGSLLDEMLLTLAEGLNEALMIARKEM